MAEIRPPTNVHGASVETSEKGDKSGPCKFGTDTGEINPLNDYPGIGHAPKHIYHAFLSHAKRILHVQSVNHTGL